MSDYNTLHDGNGKDETSPRRRGGSRGGSSPTAALRDRDSHHKYSSRGPEPEISRNRERRRDREYHRDRHQKDENDRSIDNDRGRDKYDDHDRHKSRDFDRHRGYDRDRERRHKRRSQSPSRNRSRNRSRSRSQSPSRLKSKRTSGFDMAPPNTAIMPGAIASGGLPSLSQTLPGMVQNISPSSTGMTQIGNFNQFGALSMMPAQAMTQQATRHARRVYVGGLPPLANEQTIATFFSHVMTAIGGNAAGPGDAVVNVYINHEKKFAFVEMRTVEEASNAMALDGIIFEGVAVRVRRPTDYNPALAAPLGPTQPSPHLNLAAIGLIPGSIGGADGAERIFVGGLPYYFTEPQIKELLQSFGPLRGFDLVKDKDTGNSRGYGFCVYEDPAVTDIACAALNGLKMGDKTLTVRRATISSGSGQPKPEQENLLAQAHQYIAEQKMLLQASGANISEVGIASLANGESPTKVLCLTEAIAADQLKDDEEYGEILEDMWDECRKFGALVNVVIPRPDSSGETIPGIGKVFLEYADTVGCAKARNALSGRKFEGNTVKAVYYPEDKYYSRDYSA